MSTVPCAYLHVPASLSRQGVPDVPQRYMAALETEWRMSRVPLDARILYVGGDAGVLCDEELSAFCRYLAVMFPVDTREEWTLRLSAACTSTLQAEMIETAGFNRLCVVTAVDETDVLASALSRVKAGGQFQVAVDLEVHGEPCNPDTWLDAIAIAVDGGATHISTYLGEGEDDATVALMAMIDREMQACGLERHELWSYARPGHACAYTRHTWRCGAYLGLGTSAASHIGVTRWHNTHAVDEYLDAVERGMIPPREIDRLDARKAAVDYIICGLNLEEGVSPSWIEEEVRRRFPMPGKSSSDFSNVWKTVLRNFQSLENDGFLELAGVAYRLTARGRRCADFVARSFL